MAKLKQAVSCLLAVVMLLSMCMLVPAAAAAETADGLVYEEVNEEITITGYTGAGGEVVIPAEIDNKPVTKIADMAFMASSVPAATNITKITIPDSVTTIGAGVFFGCNRLQEVLFPENVSIPSAASLFRDCTSLQTITIPKTLTEISNFMFYNCSSLINVNFPSDNQIETIGRTAFQNCVLLSEVILPEKLRSIGTRAFDGCASLTDITIYDNVTSISIDAFNNIPKEQLTIHGIAGSYAYTFAIENGYTFAAIQEGADLVTTYLQAKIDEAKGLGPALYTKESYAALQTAIAHAE